MLEIFEFFFFFEKCARFWFQKISFFLQIFQPFFSAGSALQSPRPSLVVFLIRFYINETLARCRRAKSDGNGVSKTRVSRPNWTSFKRNRPVRQLKFEFGATRSWRQIQTDRAPFPVLYRFQVCTCVSLTAPRCRRRFDT